MCDANSVADFLGVSPLYHQKQSQRWSSARQLYQMMSPEGSEPMSMPIGRNESLSNLLSPEAGWANVEKGVMSVPSRGWETPGWSGIGRKGSNVSPGESSLNSLELEAIAAVHELQFAVKDMSVSELLPRTRDLIFINLTTLEGQAYCIELTLKGWRVTSLRHDCMNGDIDHIDLHTRYFETIYAMMDAISPNYRREFSDALTARLRQLQQTSQQNSQRTSPVLEEPPGSAPVTVTVRHPSGGESRDQTSCPPPPFPQASPQAPSETRTTFTIGPPRGMP